MHEANRLIAADCANRPFLTFVDIWKPMLGTDSRPRQELFSKDKLHLSPAGYELWTRLVRPELTKSQQTSQQTSK